MSNFFKNSDLDNTKAERIVSDTLNNCDDGELYLENSKSESILLDDNKIKNSSYSSDLGYGFRAITGEVVAYSHSNDISKDSILKSSENLKDTLKSKKGTYNHEIPKSNKKYYEDLNPIEEKSQNSKIKILNEVNNYIRSKGDIVSQVTASFLGEHKEIEIIRSNSEVLKDVRPLVRFNVSVVLEKNGKKETGVYGIGGRQSYDEYLKNENWKHVCDEAFRIANINLKSKPAPAGEMKVVLGPGWPAILIHEAIGHGKEGDFNRKKTSAFQKVMGQRVASEGVTIVDDGT
jgi:Predicted Zn-dependent proteases and their inactivated homologs